jgi:hypothetical protein
MTRITLESDGYYTNTKTYGLITVSGFETPPAGLTPCKPLFGRMEAGEGTGTSWKTIASLKPMAAGNALTPTSVTFGYSCFTDSTSHKAMYRYKFWHADNSADGGAETGWITCSTSYSTLPTIHLDAHPKIWGDITEITLEALGYYTSTKTYGRITFSGYEHTL